MPTTQELKVLHRSYERADELLTIGKNKNMSFMLVLYDNEANKGMSMAGGRVVDCVEAFHLSIECVVGQLTYAFDNDRDKAIQALRDAFENSLEHMQNTPPPSVTIGL